MKYYDKNYKGYHVIGDRVDENRAYASVYKGDDDNALFTYIDPSQERTIQHCKEWINTHPINPKIKYAKRFLK